MADLGYYDDKLLKDDPNAQATQTQSPGNVSAAGTSGVVSGGGAPSNPAGVGAGGQGSWTNIQAYLKANKNDTGSAQSLDKKVSGVLGQEKQNLQTAVGDTLNKAGEQSRVYDDAKTNTKEWLNKAANAYSWDNQHGDDYRDTVEKVKGLKTQAYTGPQNFSYANSADFSRANEALNNDEAYKGYINDLYKERTGGVLNSGQAALQNQFDVNNESLASTRAKLATQMAGFDSDRTAAVTSTDAAIQAAQNKFRNSQAGYNDYLNNLANEYDSSITQQEIDARNAYDQTYNSDSGRKNYLIGGVTSDGIGDRDDIKLLPKDATWKQINDFKRQTVSDDAYEAADAMGLLDTLRSIASRSNAKYGENRSALDEFYSQQDEKYGMTADEDERKYNTLSEILGSLNKKEKGFKVRG